MSDSPLEPDWWQASDGKWYPPHLHPDALAAAAAAPPPPVPPPVAPPAPPPVPPAPAQQPPPLAMQQPPPAPAPAPAGPGAAWWQASDGQWYPPHLHPQAPAAAPAGGPPAGTAPRPRPGAGAEGGPPAYGWGTAAAASDDVIRSAPGQASVSVKLGLHDRKRLAALILVVVLLVGGGVGIAVALSGSSGPSSTTGTTAPTVSTSTTTTVADVPVTVASANALNFTLTDLPNGWADVDAGAATRSNLVPASSCSLARTALQWLAESPTFANKTGEDADQITFDQVFVTATDAQSTDVLSFAESSIYQNTCLRPVLLDTLQPYVGDQTLTKCSQPLNFGGDSISAGGATYDGASAQLLHWVGDYECPSASSSNSVRFMYVDEIVMVSGRSAVAAFFLGITAQPSASVEQKAMDDLSQRSAAHGL